MKKYGCNKNNINLCKIVVLDWVTTVRRAARLLGVFDVNYKNKFKNKTHFLVYIKYSIIYCSRCCNNFKYIMSPLGHADPLLSLLY